MSACVLVVDTSFLWDLFGIPHRDRTETDAQRTQRQEQMKQRFKNATQLNARFYVPYCVIFEIANSVAHIENSDLRKKTGDALITMVEKCIAEGTPWIVTPAQGTYLEKQHLLTLCQKFRYSSINRMGLTDVAIMHEAERLKNKYSIENRHVHIWTADNQLKKEQPDKESAKCPC